MNHISSMIIIDVQSLGITDIQSDSNNAYGKVGQIEPYRLGAARTALEAAGYQVSDSRDISGTYIWWTPGPARLDEMARMRPFPRTLPTK